MNDKDGIIS